MCGDDALAEAEVLSGQRRGAVLREVPPAERMIRRAGDEAARLGHRLSAEHLRGVPTQLTGRRRGGSAERRAAAEGHARDDGLWRLADDQAVVRGYVDDALDGGGAQQGEAAGGGRALERRQLHTMTTAVITRS